MLVRNRRSSPATGNSRKEGDAAKKRAPLSNITNQRNGGPRASLSSSTSKILVPCAARVAKTDPSVRTHYRSFTRNTSSASLDSKLNVHLPAKNTSLLINEKVPLRARSCPGPKIVESEYIDDEDTWSMKSVGGTDINKLLIYEEAHTPGSIFKRDILLDMDMVNKNTLMDPQFCTTIAADIYKHLRLSETRKMPSTDFMERVQKDINASMRAVLVDWLVEVSEEYRLVPETLFLSVNYIDRYLSDNPMSRQRLQLLGVTCMMIAAKYEEVSAPHIEDFCYITDNTYCKKEVLQMESLVLSYLKYEMSAPTTNWFLRWFAWVAHGFNEALSIQLKCLAHYLAELSLLDYSMLCYAPSLIAASAVFLAKFMLSPAEKPWNSGLRYYTLYRPSDLCRCVKALHHLCRSGHDSNVTAVRQKYSQHKYKFVAKKYCPPSIPGEFFKD